MKERCLTGGLDGNATNNLVQLVNEQKTATGQVPTDRTLVVERFRDELGDWRLILHSPYGQRVHAPWALAVSARLSERHGLDSNATASDDGIIVRLPDTEDTPPGADLFAFDTDEIEDIVTEQVGGSALFASRFRECAARALLLPRRNPGKRAPLWQQRQRSAQLLDVARKYPTFPILLETVRECLQDVYDLPALKDLFRRMARRQIRIVEVETQSPSPFAGALLFNYVGEFMYEGDSPLAERRAAALSLDSALLAELLGRVELRELLDADVIAQAELELQRLLPDRKARDLEGAADLLRILGPLTTDEVTARSTQDPHRGWTSWFAPSARSRSPSPAPTGGRRSRTPRACETDWVFRCPSVRRPHSSNPSTTHSVTCSADTRAPTDHSRSVMQPGASASGPLSPATFCNDSPRKNGSWKGNSALVPPVVSGVTRRSSVASAGVHSLQPVRKWSPSALPPWAASSRVGNMSAALCAESTESPQLWNSLPACRFPRRRSSR